MKVYFDTVGCMKNFDDSDMAMGLLERHGHSIVEDPEDADVLIVNTCGFIEPAKRESIDEIISMASYKEQGKLLVATGCLVQRYAKELFDELPEVDGFLGVNDYKKLPELLDDLQDGKRFSVNSGFDGEDDAFNDSSLRRHNEKGTYSKYLRISEGCDRNCAYCVIPAIRGPYRSRPVEDLVREAEELVKEGCRELVIIAEDTGYYGLDLYGKRSLDVLLRELCKVDGIEWIRIMYCYEDGITPGLISAIKDEDKILDYIDIPLQHASDRILKLMRRKTTKEDIEEKIAGLRNEIPDITIRTTFITGFPGETEDDVDELISFIEKNSFDRLGVFTYSREEGTDAYDMPEQVDEDVKEARRDRIMLKQLDISRAHNEALKGEILDVMVDGTEEDGSYTGRTKADAPDIDDSVLFTSDKKHVPGDIVKVLIEEAFDYDIEGREVWV